MPLDQIAFSFSPICCEDPWHPNCGLASGTACYCCHNRCPANICFTSGAMRDLSSDGAGCNSFLHLGLVEAPTLAPQVWSILQTIRMVRDCGVGTGSTWSFIFPGSPQHCSHRSQTLGWHVTRDLLLQDFFGTYPCLVPAWQSWFGAWNTHGSILLLPKCPTAGG